LAPSLDIPYAATGDSGNLLSRRAVVVAPDRPGERQAVARTARRTQAGALPALAHQLGARPRDHSGQVAATAVRPLPAGLLRFPRIAGTTPHRTAQAQSRRVRRRAR